MTESVDGLKVTYKPAYIRPILLSDGGPVVDVQTGPLEAWIDGVKLQGVRGMKITAFTIDEFPMVSIPADQGALAQYERINWASVAVVSLAAVALVTLFLLWG